MSCYFMAYIRISDQREYQKYLEGADRVFEKYKGEYYTKAVLIRFDSPEDFHSWYDSPEYRQILKHRLKASDCDSILIHGKPHSHKNTD